MNAHRNNKFTKCSLDYCDYHSSHASTHTHPNQKSKIDGNYRAMRMKYAKRKRLAQLIFENEQKQNKMTQWNNSISDYDNYAYFQQNRTTGRIQFRWKKLLENHGLKSDNTCSEQLPLAGKYSLYNSASSS